MRFPPIQPMRQATRRSAMACAPCWRQVSTIFCRRCSVSKRKLPMMKLYWSPRSRSFTALWLMEETGAPYERVLTDITTGAQRSPEYLAINPMGKVPALQDGNATMAEAAAICAYVAERYPDAKLAPPVGDPQRAKYLYWLFYGPGCIEPAIVQLATKIDRKSVV